MTCGLWNSFDLRCQSGIYNYICMMVTHIVNLIKLPPCITIVHLINKIFRLNCLYSVSQAARGPCIYVDITESKREYSVARM